jgi:glycosyltransferase involved in cell wall biosynthesis
MLDSPKLSIIIPTIGRDVLVKTVQQIVSQVKQDSLSVELILVFDGIWERELKEDFEKELFIHCFETGKRSGASSARNIGLDQANGEVILFLGDDTIPEGDCLTRHLNFHLYNKKPYQALLGMVDWTQELKKDSFHEWLLDNAQFDFKYLQTNAPTWKHFYTSNISLKRSFVGESRFSSEFTGWGFEDTELGYRLSKRGMELSFDPRCRVAHDHGQTLDQVLKNTKYSKKNARIFEKLHPEIEILPRGLKRIILIQMLVFVWFIKPFKKEFQWWYVWKKAWLF